MAMPKPVKRRTLGNLLKRVMKSDDEDDDADASLMSNESNKTSSKFMQFDQDQTQMLQKICAYHAVDTVRLKRKFKKTSQFEAFLRRNQNNIDEARTSHVILLGPCGSGKTKVWWNFLHYFSQSYLESASWGLSPKDFYHILTEKIMNISVDLLREYNYHQSKPQNTPDDIDIRVEAEFWSSSLTRNLLAEEKEYTLELDDAEVKEGHDFFQDLISKLDKIVVAVTDNMTHKTDGTQPNWDKIQELRKIEKEMKQFTPGTAPKLRKLWKSEALRNFYLYQYGLQGARNLFYFIEHIDKFVAQRRNAEEQSSSSSVVEHAVDDLHHKQGKRGHKPPAVKRWEWNWSFEEVLRCEIRTTGVIEQCICLDPDNAANDEHFSLQLKVIDVGGAQNERKKWKHILSTGGDKPGMDCVVFVVNLMSYYKKSWESNTNGLWQSLQLFACLLSEGEEEEAHMHAFHEHKTADAAAGSEVEDMCIDARVKRAVDNVSLFYVVFTDTEGLTQMLHNGVSFKVCFPDYDGDDSVEDVQQFIQSKFQQIVDDSNARMKTQKGRQNNSNHGRARKQNIDNEIDDESPSFQRVSSVKQYQEIRDIKKQLKRHQTAPNATRLGLDDEGYDDELSDNEIVMQAQAAKKLECRFVSVINHHEMKTVMNEIVQKTFLNKSALDPVVHSLIE